MTSVHRFVIVVLAFVVMAMVLATVYLLNIGSPF